MKIALIVLKGFRNNFNFDVLKGKHAKNLPPTRHASTK